MLFTVLLWKLSCWW